MTTSDISKIIKQKETLSNKKSRKNRWEKAIIMHRIHFLESELENIINHFYENKITPFEHSISANFLAEELSYYKNEFEKYFVKSNARINELVESYRKIDEELKNVDNEDEFYTLSHYQSVIEDDVYLEHKSQETHLNQEFTSLYSIFEGTLRLCIRFFQGEYPKSISNNKKNGKNSENQTFARFESMFKDVFPRNNQYWKRINGIYTIINNSIKHNDSHLPSKDFGLTTLINFDKKRSNSIVENRKIKVTQELNNELLNDLISFANIKQIRKITDEFYTRKGKNEYIKTLDCYSTFSNIYHIIESNFDQIFEEYDRIHETKTKYGSIKKTGIEKINHYITENEIFKEVVNNNYYQQFINGYRLLANRMKHNKGNLILVDDRDDDILKYLAKNIEVKKNIEISNNVIGLNFDFIIDFYENSSKFIKKFSDYMRNELNL